MAFFAKKAIISARSSLHQLVSLGAKSANAKSLPALLSCISQSGRAWPDESVDTFAREKAKAIIRAPRVALHDRRRRPALARTMAERAVNLYSTCN